MPKYKIIKTQFFCQSRVSGKNPSFVLLKIVNFGTNISIHKFASSTSICSFWTKKWIYNTLCWGRANRIEWLACKCIFVDSSKPLVVICNCRSLKQLLEKISGMVPFWRKNGNEKSSKVLAKYVPSTSSTAFECVIQFLP